MVYKVTGEFTSENLPEIIEELKSKFLILFREGTLYLALKNYRTEVESYREMNESDGYENVEEVRKRLKKEIRGVLLEYMSEFGTDEEEDSDTNFWIKTMVSKQSITKEDEFVRNWIEFNMVRLEGQQLEVEKQEILASIMNKLDLLEEELNRRAMKIIERKRRELEKTEREGSLEAIQDKEDNIIDTETIEDNQ